MSIHLVNRGPDVSDKRLIEVDPGFLSSRKRSAAFSFHNMIVSFINILYALYFAYVLMRYQGIKVDSSAESELQYAIMKAVHISVYPNGIDFFVNESKTDFAKGFQNLDWNLQISFSKIVPVTILLITLCSWKQDFCSIHIWACSRNMKTINNALYLCFKSIFHDVEQHLPDQR